MSNYNKRMVFILSFITWFFFRLGFFLFGGIVLCIMGQQNRTCLAVGVAFIAFDFIASLIRSIRGIMLMDKFDLPYERKSIDLSDNDSEQAVSARTLEFFLRSRLDDDSTLEQCVDVFCEMCEDPIEDETIMFLADTSRDKLFHIELTRQFPDEEYEFYDVTVDIAYQITDKNKHLREHTTQVDPQKFKDKVKESKAYNLHLEEKIEKVEIYVEQT